MLLIFINCLCFTWLEEWYVLSSFMTDGLALAFDVALWQRKLEFLLRNWSLLEGSLLQQFILPDFAASVVWVSVQISRKFVFIGFWRILLLFLTLVLRVSIFVEESIIDVCLPLSLRTLWGAACLWYQRHVCAVSVDCLQLFIRSLLLGDYLRFRLGLDLTIWLFFSGLSFWLKTGLLLLSFWECFNPSLCCRVAGSWVLILQVRHDVMLLQIVQIHGIKELRQRLFSLFKLVEELLRMWTSLCRSPCHDMLLDSLPLLSKELERFQKPEMLILGPASHFIGSIHLLGKRTSNHGALRLLYFDWFLLK